MAHDHTVVPLFPTRDEPRETKRELARRWGVSERSIERWMRERGLPFEKPFEGGMVRFVPSVVDKWWRSHGNT